MVTIMTNLLSQHLFATDPLCNTTLCIYLDFVNEKLIFLVAITLQGRHLGSIYEDKAKVRGYSDFETKLCL